MTRIVRLKLRLITPCREANPRIRATVRYKPRVVAR